MGTYRVHLLDGTNEDVVADDYDPLGEDGWEIFYRFVPPDADPLVAARREVRRFVASDVVRCQRVE